MGHLGQKIEKIPDSGENPGFWRKSGILTKIWALWGRFDPPLTRFDPPPLVGGGTWQARSGQPGPSSGQKILAGGPESGSPPPDGTGDPEFCQKIRNFRPSRAVEDPFSGTRAPCRHSLPRTSPTERPEKMSNCNNELKLFRSLMNSLHTHSLLVVIPVVTWVRWRAPEYFENQRIFINSWPQPEFRKIPKKTGIFPSGYYINASFSEKTTFGSKITPAQNFFLRLLAFKFWKKTENFRKIAIFRVESIAGPNRPVADFFAI